PVSHSASYWQGSQSPAEPASTSVQESAAGSQTLPLQWLSSKHSTQVPLAVSHSAWSGARRSHCVLSVHPAAHRLSSPHSGMVGSSQSASAMHSTQVLLSASQAGAASSVQSSFTRHSTQVLSPSRS